jgi:chromosome segregation protein
LSGGGKGELFLEKPDDPFKGGLSMWAKPPGKSSKVKLEQLSGGEQSIASLALIFAIQDYDPSPFYYFDEVDQNLDPINAERIATMCRLRSEKAQFIQVTLRKVSLQLADHHIGITHAGDGCSRRIANFDRERAIELGEKAFAELKDNVAANERQDLLERLGDLPDPNDMELIPEEIEYPESLGGLEDEGETETTVNEAIDESTLLATDSTSDATSDATNPLGDLQARTADLSEDIDEEQNLHKAISQADAEAPDDSTIEAKTIDEGDE